MRGFSRFSIKICCLTVPKNFVGEPFRVSQCFWYPNFLWIRGEGEGVLPFCVKLFLSQCRKSSLGKPLVFHYFPVSRNFMPMIGISRISIESLLFHSTEKLCWGTLLCFTKFLVSKSLMDKRGGEDGGSITIFGHNFFLSQCQKFWQGNPSVFL